MVCEEVCVLGVSGDTRPRSVTEVIMGQHKEGLGCTGPEHHTWGGLHSALADTASGITAAATLSEVSEDELRHADASH